MWRGVIFGAQFPPALRAVLLFSVRYPSFRCHLGNLGRCKACQATQVTTNAENYHIRCDAALAGPRACDFGLRSPHLTRVWTGTLLYAGFTMRV